MSKKRKDSMYSWICACIIMLIILIFVVISNRTEPIMDDSLKINVSPYMADLGSMLTEKYRRGPIHYKSQNFIDDTLGQKQLTK